MEAEVVGVEGVGICGREEGGREVVGGSGSGVGGGGAIVENDEDGECCLAFLDAGDAGEDNGVDGREGVVFVFVSFRRRRSCCCCCI